MNRRDLLGSLGLLGALLAGTWPKPVRARLRPPGALPEAEFEERCIRCFRCAEVCPPTCIRLDPSAVPRLADLPVIDAAERACVLCMRCTEVCPTGALERVPADPPTVQQRVRMGRPVLDQDLCIAWKRTGVCRLCYYACPYPETAIRLSGPQQAPVFQAMHCVGCGLCEEACPKSARAIVIDPDPGPDPGPGPATGAPT